MKIELYKKAPKCPKCKSPMKYETYDITKVDKSGKAVGGKVSIFSKYCKRIPIYRCSKCLDLYRVEE